MKKIFVHTDISTVLDRTQKCCDHKEGLGQNKLQSNLYFKSFIPQEVLVLVLKRVS